MSEIHRTNLGVFYPHKTPEIAPEMGFFHVKFKHGGRFGRAVRRKTCLRAKTNPCGLRNTWSTNLGYFNPKTTKIAPQNIGFPCQIQSLITQ